MISWVLVICSSVVSQHDTIIGIDLGTTYSVVGVYENGKVEIVANDQGNRITPSYVSFHNGERLVGDAAKNQFSQNPTNTIFGVKRLIGRRASDPDVTSESNYFPFNVLDKNGKCAIQVETEPGVKQDFTPEEVSAWVLGKMKETAEAYLGRPVGKAVITVPAYFNDEQRQATKDAGTIAGLEVVRILNEPTAAAIAYGLDKRGETAEKNVIVFDLGGGTFDVSLLTIDNGVFEVLATNGDTHLGGEDFDQRIMQHFIKLYQRKTGHDLTTDQRSLAKLRRECEKAKRTLSSTLSTKIEIESLFNGVDFVEVFTRAKFEELNADLFKRTLIPVQKVLDDSGLSKEEIDEVVLVGGSTRIPKIQELVKTFLGKEPAKGINVDESIAYGAAVHAAVIGGVPMDNTPVIIDTAPLTLGIETVGNIMTPIIPRNTAIPARRAKIFSTAVDNQETVSVQVFEGERPVTSSNNLLGKFDLTGISPAARGVPQLEVTFEINTDGILRVSAEDKGTGNIKNIQIANQSNRLRPEEIQRMIEEAERMLVEDEIIRNRITTRQELESYVYGRQNQINTDDTIKSNLTAEQVQLVNDAIEDTITWLDANPQASIEELKSATTNLVAQIDEMFAVKNQHNEL